MYADMEQWNDIRRRVLVDGVSKRSILRETGMHWRTLNKILTHSEPDVVMEFRWLGQAFQFSLCWPLAQVSDAWRIMAVNFGDHNFKLISKLSFFFSEVFGTLSRRISFM
jgi:hypothetical protein